MVTTYTHGEDFIPDRPALVAALRSLADYYGIERGKGGASEPPEIRNAKLRVAQTVTAFAMSQFCERLVAEGYVVPARAAELRQRSDNLRRGVGFLLTPADTGSPAAAPAAASPLKVESPEDIRRALLGE